MSDEGVKKVNRRRGWKVERLKGSCVQCAKAVALEVKRLKGQAVVRGKGQTAKMFKY